MTQQIFLEIENMRSKNVSVGDMATSLSGKFRIDIETARLWITTAALANGLGVSLEDL